MEPVELTSLEALQERIEQDGVITVTRGTFAVPMAMTDRPRQFPRRRPPFAFLEA